MSFQTLGMDIIEFIRKLKEEADLALIGDRQDKRKIAYKDMMNHAKTDEPEVLYNYAYQKMEERKQEFLQRIGDPKLKEHIESLSSEEKDKYLNRVVNGVKDR